ncbi:MAG: response regulator transcription factor [Pseudomonadota bacterium]
MYTFQVADDHPLFRNAIMEVIKHHYPEAIVNTSHNLEGTIRDLEQNPDTDLLLLDIHMPGSQDLFGLIMVRQKFPTVPVTIISANDNHSTINRAIGHGACGYIPKSCSPQDIYQAVDAILKGDRWVPKDSRNSLRPIDSEEKDLAAKVATLTPQQYRVLCHLREGWLNKQIGYEMGLTEATIKAHITAIFRKLGITNRTQTVISLNKLSLDDVIAN